MDLESFGTVTLVVITSSIAIYLLSVFGMRGKSYEEVKAEHGKLHQETKIKLNKKKEKPKKSKPKDSRSKNDSNHAAETKSETQQVSSDESVKMAPVLKKPANADSDAQVDKATINNKPDAPNAGDVPAPVVVINPEIVTTAKSNDNKIVDEKKKDPTIDSAVKTAPHPKSKRKEKNNKEKKEPVKDVENCEKIVPPVEPLPNVSEVKNELSMPVEDRVDGQNITEMSAIIIDDAMKQQPQGAASPTKKLKKKKTSLLGM